MGQQFHPAPCGNTTDSMGNDCSADEQYNDSCGDHESSERLGQLADIAVKQPDARQLATLVQLAASEDLLGGDEFSLSGYTSRVDEMGHVIFTPQFQDASDQL